MATRRAASSSPVNCMGTVYGAGWVRRRRIEGVGHVVVQRSTEGVFRDQFSFPDLEFDEHGRLQ